MSCVVLFWYFVFMLEQIELAISVKPSESVLRSMLLLISYGDVNCEVVDFNYGEGEVIRKGRVKFDTKIG